MCGLRRDFEIRQNLIFKICADAHTNNSSFLTPNLKGVTMLTALFIGLGSIGTRHLKI